MRKRHKAVHPAVLELMVEEHAPTLQDLAVALKLPASTVLNLADLPPEMHLDLCPLCHQQTPESRVQRRNAVP